MNRTGQILSAVDALIVAHDAWEADDTAPDVPTLAIEDALTLAVDICRTGDVPQQCRELIDVMYRLGFEWEKYADGDRLPNHKPRGSFWGAYRAVLKAREGATPIELIPPEPVALLRKQHVTDAQIALHIYGDGTAGPLVGPNGQPDVHKINQEAHEPGSVIPKDWVHKDQILRKQQHDEQLQRRLAAIEHREEIGQEDPATIEELLRAGQFPETVARVKNVSLAVVRKISDALESEGVTINELPNLAAMRAPGEPQITPEQDAALQPRKAPESQSPNGSAPKQAAAPTTPEELDELIILVAEDNPDASASDLVAILRDEHQAEVNVQKVAAVLRKRPKEAVGAE